ncbi:hypothetical protein [uncultured Roseobacter sp.]|uniref:hypothetical protein n=1 Tax=uncultured Roseobacter sp. TaxID=114847 RepID=UPI00263312BB|nr:hypothetical protein [uncultured Roseobacter sp.]
MKLSGVFLSLFVAIGVGTIVTAAGNDPYGTAVGQVAAAYEMQQECNSVGSFGPEDYQGFVLSATEVLKKQGLRKNKMRKLLFYGQTVWIQQEKARILAERGVNDNNSSAVCSFARNVAGKNDTIGQFLVRE